LHITRSFFIKHSESRSEQIGLLFARYKKIFDKDLVFFNNKKKSIWSAMSNIQKVLVFLPSCFLLLFGSLKAETVGIIAGSDSFGTICYAAFVNSDGTTTTINIPSAGTAFIDDVDMNIYKQSLVAGRNNTTYYAAFISPSGIVTPIVLPAGPTSLSRCAINNKGDGILGDINGSYIARVSSSGVLTQLPLPSLGGVQRLDINDSGTAVIAAGAQGTGPFFQGYAFYNYSNGTNISIPVPSDVTMYGAAINESGTALFGGSRLLAKPTVAFVSPSGTITPVTISNNASIRGVDINESGLGIISGQYEAAPSSFFAAFVSSSGTITPIAISGSGELGTAKINSSGTVLLGGQYNGITPAAFLVSSSGTVTTLSVPATATLNVDSVDLNDAGVGLIGASTSGVQTGFAALVAPNGTLTMLNLPTDYGAESVSLQKILISTVPQKSSSLNAMAVSMNAMFNCINALESRSMISHKNVTFQKMDNLYKANHSSSNEIALIADASCEIASIDPNLGKSGLLRNKKSCMHVQPPSIQPQTIKDSVSVWASLLGDYSHQKARRAAPEFISKVGGVIAGAEYQFLENRKLVLGGGFAYAYNHVHYPHRIGHASINQGFSVLYGSYNMTHFFMNVALWGGFFDMHNTRYTLGEIPSKSQPKGWLLTPHLEVSVPLYIHKCDWVLFEPLAMFDWANDWQKHFSEHGASGLNVSIKHQYSSLLRSEVGLRVFEILRYRWGRFILEEKLSYVNKKPFHTPTTTAFFIGGASTFGISVFSSKTLNLGVANMGLHFYPNKEKYPYGSLNFQSELSSSSQEYMAILNIAKNF
jgi:hypothetical protein